MDATIAQQLRAQFKPEEIGKLPRITCKACSDSRGGNCGEHSKAKCDECGSYITVRHIHLDFVGHADVTSRLLEVDPEWNWEPKAEDEHGFPVFDTDERGSPVGLWIKLTVGGVTRLGYGSAPSNQRDAVKVLIGDALRNAAMRFGVALDLWAKGDRADPAAENATASAGQAARRGPKRESAGDAFDSASPQPPARPNGHTVRPEGNGKPAAPASDEVDPDAQVFADEAHQARTVAALRDVNTRAREAHKLASIVRSPGGEGTGGLGQYIALRKKQLEDDAAALAELQKAAEDTRTSMEALEIHVQKVTGTGIEGATPAQLREAADKLLALTASA